LEFGSTYLSLSTSGMSWDSKGILRRRFMILMISTANKFLLALKN
jgi:hypothetical protein